MAGKIAVVIFSLFARWWPHDYFSISPARAGLTPYKIVWYMLAGWWRHNSLSISPARSGLVPYKLVWYMLARAHHYLLALVRYIQIDLIFYVYQITSNGVSHWIWMNRMMMNMNSELQQTTKNTWNYFASV